MKFRTFDRIYTVHVFFWVLSGFIEGIVFSPTCLWLGEIAHVAGFRTRGPCCEPFCSLWEPISWACTQDTAMGGAGTAVKLASHFHMARHLVEAGEGGLDHASLCKEAQALGTRKQLQPGFLFHPGRQWMLRGTLSMRYTVAWLKVLDEYQRASLRKICDSKQKCATAIQGNAGDVLLLHPHLAHSSTTNVRFGRDVRVALTKRAYWITGMVSGIWVVFEMLDGWVPLVFVWIAWQNPNPVSSPLAGPAETASLPVELPLSWARKRTRCH